MGGKKLKMANGNGLVLKYSFFHFTPFTPIHPAQVKAVP